MGGRGGAWGGRPGRGGRHGWRRGAGAGGGGGGGGGGAGGEPAETGWRVDKNYGEAGIARLPGLEPIDAELRHLTQPDGKVVVIDGIRAVALRLLPDGKLDPSFGVGGTASYGGELFHPQSLALQPDGKILISGFDEANNLVVPTVRLLPDGTLDPSFGQGGRAELGLLGNQSDDINDLKVLPDGMIVGVGVVHKAGSCGGILTFRLLPAGEADKHFGVPAGSDVEGPGFSIFSSSDLAPELGACVVDRPKYLRANADGSIDVLGTAKNFVRTPTLSADHDVFWAKLNAEGLLDTSFGTAGWAFFETAPGSANSQVDEASSVSPTTAGGFLVAVRTYVDMTSGWAILKLTPEGALEPSFGAQGVVVGSPVPSKGLNLDTFFSATSLPDDSALVVGWVHVEGRPRFTDYGEIAMVQHLLANGSRDESVGEGGVFSFDLGLTSLVPKGALLQVDGSVLVCAQAYWNEPFFHEFYPAIVRVLPPIASSEAGRRAGP